MSLEPPPLRCRCRVARAAVGAPGIRCRWNRRSADPVGAAGAARGLARIAPVQAARLATSSPTSAQSRYGFGRLNGVIWFALPPAVQRSVNECENVPRRCGNTSAGSSSYSIHMGVARPILHCGGHRRAAILGQRVDGRVMQPTLCDRRPPGGARTGAHLRAAMLRVGSEAGRAAGSTVRGRGPARLARETYSSGERATSSGSARFMAIETPARCSAVPPLRVTTGTPIQVASRLVVPPAKGKVSRPTSMRW